MGIEFVQLDTGSKIKLHCVDDDLDTAIDLTGGTVRLRYKIAGGALQTRVMSIVGAPVNGDADYLFQSGELTPGGGLECEFEITDSGGKVITSLETFKFGIRTKLA